MEKTTTFETDYFLQNNRIQIYIHLGQQITFFISRKLNKEKNIICTYYTVHAIDRIHVVEFQTANFKCKQF